MRSVQRILAIFESFSAARTSLTLQEIADRIELPKSTAFRIVRSLEQAGYLVRLEDLTYCLSFRFIRLAGLVKSNLDVRDIARPILASLAAATGETSSLHMIMDGQRVCLDSAATSSPLRSVVQPGEHVPLAGGSATKVLVAYLPESERRPMVAVMASATGRDTELIAAELAEVRHQGYAVSHGERLPGVSAVSAPIHDLDDRVRYCLSVGGPSFRVQPRQAELVALTVQAAATTSYQLGGGTGAAAFAIDDDANDSLNP